MPCAAGRGTFTPGIAAPRTAAATSRRTASTTSGSALRPSLPALRNGVRLPLVPRPSLGTRRSVAASRPQQLQPLERAAQGILGRQLQPLLQHRGVHLPEVEANLQVAVLGVQVR